MQNASLATLISTEFILKKYSSVAHVHCRVTAHPVFNNLRAEKNNYKYLKPLEL